MIFPCVPYNGLPYKSVPFLGLPGWRKWPSKKKTSEPTVQARAGVGFYTVNEKFLEILKTEDMEILELVKHIVKSGILQAGRK